MTRLPSLRANEVIQILEKARFYIDRTTGSHYVMRHPDGRGPIVIPFHGGRDIKKGVLRAIITRSGLSVDEFLNLR